MRNIQNWGFVISSQYKSNFFKCRYDCRWRWWFIVTWKYRAGIIVTSGALTGIQSHVSQNYYREKTFEIITKAIEVRRKTIWSDITAKQLRDTTEDNFSYTMNEAISDAIEYNNACSVIAGFEEISDSVESKSQDVDEAALLQKANIMIKPNANGIIETQGAPVSGVGTSNLSIDEILTIRRWNSLTFPWVSIP